MSAEKQNRDGAPIAYVDHDGKAHVLSHLRQAISLERDVSVTRKEEGNAAYKGRHMPSVWSKRGL